jgi:hypothetical protein
LADWFIVEEDSYDARILKSLLKTNLIKYNVTVRCSRPFSKNDVLNFDHIVVSGYERNNAIGDILELPPEQIQYEICEKPIVTLDRRFEHTSTVLIDGPLMCVDPFGSSGLFVLGHVTEAIHSHNIGFDPHIPSHLARLINRGPQKPPPFSRGPRFISEFHKYFIGSKILHEASLFTLRAVPPNRDHDDFRPSEIKFYNNGRSRVFAGKVVSCVHIANHFLGHLNNP